ncbi:MAG: hypothetical protein E7508_02105 [Ruminococcus sp.]|nr:hypothetical protein [Ruminococcus sp.]
MPTIVNANPTKELFISMLTRDIDIKAAILELIDNSIDGAKRLRPDGNYTGLFININYDTDKFLISDNCGGIGIEIATEYAFRFGRSSKREKNPSNQQFTGIFGIGMKRSLFRLGNRFKVTSITKTDSFILDVDVEEWVKNEDTNWTFELTEENKGLNNTEEETGTTIEISNLHEGIKKQFSLDFFYNSLISYIERYRTLAIENGLCITLNGKPIVFASEKIISSSTVTPYTYSTSIGSVVINIIAGMAPKGMPDNAGWYVYCNGRLIVFADKTTLTGWGEDGVRQHHPSLAFFRGFVFFESKDLEELPWNTTKTNVDASSQYYIFAKTKMREATLQIIKDCHAIIENTIPEELEKQLFSDRDLKALTSTSIQSFVKESKPFAFEVPELKTIEPSATITFQKLKKDIDIMKRHMNVKSNKEVGMISFDYYYKKECDTDE